LFYIKLTEKSRYNVDTTYNSWYRSTWFVTAKKDQDCCKFAAHREWPISNEHY